MWLCKYGIVITVIVRQDVDDYFGTTLKPLAGMFEVKVWFYHLLAGF